MPGLRPSNRLGKPGRVGKLPARGCVELTTGGCPPINVARTYPNPTNPTFVRLTAQIELPTGCTVISAEWDDGNGNVKPGLSVTTDYPNETAVYEATVTIVLECGGQQFPCRETLTVRILFTESCSLCDPLAPEYHPETAIVTTMGFGGIVADHNFNPPRPVNPRTCPGEGEESRCLLANFTSTIARGTCNSSSTTYNANAAVRNCCGGLCYFHSLEIFFTTQVFNNTFVNLKFIRLLVRESNQFISHRLQSDYMPCEAPLLGETIVLFPRANESSSQRCTEFGLGSVFFPNM